MGTVKIKDLLDILTQDNVKILRAKLPYKIGGICKLDGSKYIILLNTHGKSKPVTSLLHELIHIYYDDLESKNTVDFVEYRAYIKTKILRKNINNKVRNILSKIIEKSERLKT